MPSSPPKKQAGGKRKQSKKQPASFNDVLEAAEQLDADSQVELIAILKLRIAERGRVRLIAAVREARRDFAEGRYEEKTATEIVREALS